jgi:hypothetical protein
VAVVSFILLAASGLLYAATDPASDWLGKATGPVILAFFLILLLRGDLVTKRECNEVREERDRFREIVLTQGEIARRALEVSEKASS